MLVTVPALVEVVTAGGVVDEVPAGVVAADFVVVVVVADFVAVVVVGAVGAGEVGAGDDMIGEPGGRSGLVAGLGAGLVPFAGADDLTGAEDFADPEELAWCAGVVRLRTVCAA